jgi:di/tricarboxylate transporter
MSAEAAFTLALLVITLVVMAAQWLRADLTALLVMLVLIFSGILSPEEAFSAFGQPVIIILASIYVLGAALFETGVANIIADQLLRVAARGPIVLLVAVMLTAAAMSAFLSGLLVVAVLMPAVLRLGRQTGIGRARLLLPMVTAATIGNQLTLIGTTSNLIISDLLAVSGFGSIGFFALTPLAVVSVGLAVLWYGFIGQRFLKERTPAEPSPPSLGEVAASYGLRDLLFQLRVRSASPIIAQRLDASELRSRYGLNVIAVKPHDTTRLQAASPHMVLEQDDLLVVQGRQPSVIEAASRLVLEVKRPVELEELAGLEEHPLRLAEVMVPMRSPLVGQTLAEADFRDQFGLAVLAAHRRGQAIRLDLPSLTLAEGDTLLVEGTVDRLRGLESSLGLVRVSALGPQPGDVVTRNARLVVMTLVGLVLAVVSGLAPLEVASLAAAVILVLMGCISPRRAYQSINGRMLVVIGGMLPLSAAMQNTGAAQILADGIVGLSVATGPVSGLVLLFLLASIITQVVSNAVTAVLITPIAISLALTQGLSPVPFAMAMVFAVNTAYATPLTDSNNLYVQKAGRYTMRDYLVNGLPLFLLQTTAILGALALRI